MIRDKRTFAHFGVGTFPNTPCTAFSLFNRLLFPSRYLEITRADGTLQTLQDKRNVYLLTQLTQAVGHAWVRIWRSRRSVSWPRSCSWNIVCALRQERMGMQSNGIWGTSLRRSRGNLGEEDLGATKLTRCFKVDWKFKRYGGMLV